MHKTLSDLAQYCRHILQETPQGDGLAKIAAHLQTILANPENIETLIPDGTGERDLLYEDPDLGFCILAHSFDGAKTSPPHDHGPSWAIYAQARGETEMRDYEIITPATTTVAGTVKLCKAYRLTPGDVHVYQIGDLHSPSRDAPTSLLRIEGTDMSKVKRLRYEIA